MVLAYQCPEHGWHYECDVATDGQRICPTDESDIAVTGITGSARGPRPGRDGFSGEVYWTVTLGWGSRTGRVAAHDLDDALDAAIEKYGDDHTVTEIKPSHRDDRRDRW